MSSIPSPCLVDTNVPIAANGKSDASPDCVRSCVAAIRKVTTSGRLVLDQGWEIIREYRHKLSQSGQPGVGDEFLKWVLVNRANPNRCERVPITRVSDNDFKEFPSHPGLKDFDNSDKKFVAVAAAHVDHPPILQATDSKWWGWRSALTECGIEIEFLCREEIAAKSAEKYKRK